jgi:hypothetical protein
MVGKSRQLFLVGKREEAVGSCRLGKGSKERYLFSELGHAAGASGPWIGDGVDVDEACCCCSCC